MGLMIVAFYFSASFFGSWTEFVGIQQSFRTAGCFYYMTLVISVAVIAAVATGVFLLFKHRMQKGFTRFLYLSAFLASVLTMFLVVNYLNVQLDSTPGARVELELTDLFALEMQRRDYRRPFIYHYAALSVPEGLENYALILLHEDASQRYVVGQKFIGEQHPGFFALPWYEFCNTIRGTRNEKLNVIKARFMILSAKGTFSQDSSYRKWLRDLGVPISDL